MRRVLFCTVLALLALIGHATPGRADSPPTVGTLVLALPMAHQGDVVYLSGGGFPASTRVTITFACPPDPSSTAPTSMNGGIQGPMTDRHGTFIGFSFKVPDLGEAPGPSGIACGFVAITTKETNGGEAQIGYSSAALLLILPDDQSFTRKPAVSVGYEDWVGASSFVLQSWPGAKLDLSIHYTRTRTDQHVTAKTNWYGAVVITPPRGALASEGDQPVSVAWTARFHKLQGAGTLSACLTGHPLRQKKGACSS